MATSPELDVADVAKLARIELNEEETRLFQAQLGQVLQHAEKLREVEASDVQPAAHANPLFNVFREDQTGPSLTAEEALKNAPRQANGFFIVTKVME